MLKRALLRDQWRGFDVEPWEIYLRENRFDLFKSYCEWKEKREEQMDGYREQIKDLDASRRD